MLTMLAQVAASAPTALQEWGPPIGTLAGSGFSAFVCWYLLTKSVPKQQERSDALIATLTAQFTNELKQSREMFERDSIADRTAFELHMAHFREDNRRMLDKLTERYEKHIHTQANLMQQTVARAVDQIQKEP